MLTPSMASNLSGIFSERMKRGLTRKDVAMAVRVSERAIAKFEQGIQYRTKETYNSLAEFFGWEVWQ